ncbi:hypothetical protein V8C44DRAFT_333075 [Trichoderma aethiopicum]
MLGAGASHKVRTEASTLLHCHCLPYLRQVLAGIYFSELLLLILSASNSLYTPWIKSHNIKKL